ETRGWSAGRRQGAALRLPSPSRLTGLQGRTSRSASAPTASTLLPRAAAFGVRAASNGGRSASRGSTGCALSAHPPRSAGPNAAIDDALDWARLHGKISAVWRPGISFLARLLLRGLRRRKRQGKRLLQALRIDLDLDAGALLFEQHHHTRIALRPAAVHRFGHLGVGEIADAHRQAELAAERGGKADVLVREPKR